MNKKVKWTRWHRYDDNGTKYIKRFELNENPESIVEEGYTQWVRGTGPLGEEQYNNVVNAVRAVSKGVPKTPATREKMRQAKLGKPKTEAHKKALSKAWEIRRLTPMTEEHKKNLSLSMKKPRQDAYREAMSKLQQLRWNNG
jgi:hypothetical protein